jgi:tRNA (guanine37-N1)-methyltransferase
VNVLVASACVKVNKQDAQDVKTALVKGGLIDSEREALHEGDSVVFPVKDGSEAAIEAIVPCPFEICAGKCPASRKKRVGNLADLLARAVPRELVDMVPRSFNIVGTIAVLEIDEQLTPFKESITMAMLDLHPHLTSIFSKQSERTGEFRTSNLDLLWGNGDPITTHVENGCRFLVDVKDAFFDPRLVHEHARVIDSINAGCKDAGTFNVLDLFCGVGPFVVPLAKDPRINAWAVDLNPRAIELLVTNLKANRIDTTRVHGHAMDARAFLDRLDLDGGTCPRAFDAIILNLPRVAHEFLGACKPRSRDGTRLFWYTIAREFFEEKELPGATPAEIQERLRSVAREGDTNPVSEICMAGLDVVKALGFTIARITRVKPFSPYKFTYCFELIA